MRRVNVGSLYSHQRCQRSAVSGGTQPLLADPALQTGDTSGDPIVIGAGDIAECGNDRDLWTSILLDNVPGPPLSRSATMPMNPVRREEFRDCYGPTWGRHKDRIKPVPGNHEYLTGGAFGYFDYFGDVATPLEPGCRKECGGYYSYDVGTWHIVALNSEINGDPGSPQEQWLRADLAAIPASVRSLTGTNRRFSSGYHGDGAGQALFQALYESGPTLCFPVMIMTTNVSHPRTQADSMRQIAASGSLLSARVAIPCATTNLFNPIVKSATPKRGAYSS